MSTSQPEKHIPGFVVRYNGLNSIYDFIRSTDDVRAFYLQAAGGSGKTRILQYIEQRGQPFDSMLVGEIIDFYDLNNISLVGLMDSIISRLEKLLPTTLQGANDRFRAYRTYRKKLSEVQTRNLSYQIDSATPSNDELGEVHNIQWDEAAKNLNMAAALERRLSRAVIDLCNEIQSDEPIILLFDTFERAHMGTHWFTEVFLNEVKNPHIFIIIGGRPSEDDEIRLGDNAITYPLTGYSLDELLEYIPLARKKKHFDADLPDDKTIEWLLTDPECQGNPLRIELFFEHIDPVTIQPKGWLNREISGRYFKPQSDRLLDFRYRTLRLMAILHRRFAEGTLEYFVEQDYFFDTDGMTRDQVLGELRQMPMHFPFLKAYDSLKSHLLHDEMQRLLLNVIKDDREIPEVALRHAHDWYRQEIGITRGQNTEKSLLLEAEDFGYLVDEYFDFGGPQGRRNYQAGIDRYKALRNESSKTRIYGFEEMLWNELVKWLDVIPDEADDPLESTRKINPRYDLCYDRLDWLYRQSLFGSMKRFVLYIKRRFDLLSPSTLDGAQLQDWVEIQRFNCYALFRLADYDAAIAELKDSKSIIEAQHSILPYADYYAADYDRLLGEVYYASGDWDRALDTFDSAFANFQNDYAVNNQIASLHGKVATRNSRCRIYAMRAAGVGDFEAAREEWQRGHRNLDEMESIDGVTPESRRLRAFLHANEGTAHRNAKDYHAALDAYRLSLEIARESNHQEALLYAYQFIGITYVRRSHDSLLQGDIDKALTDLEQAAPFLFRGINILPDELIFVATHGFRRLARFYSEFGNIEQRKDAQTPQLQEKIGHLREIIDGFLPPTEDYDDIVIFKRFTPFEDLTSIREKVVRLHEIAARLSDRTQSIRDAKENWSNAMLVLLEHFPDDQNSISRMRDKARGTVQDYSSLADLFANLRQFDEGFAALLALSDASTWQEQDDGIIERMAGSLAALSRERSIAIHIFRNRLDLFGEIIKSFKMERARTWCDALTQQWKTIGVWAERTDFRNKIEEVREHTLKRNAPDESI